MNRARLVGQVVAGACVFAVLVAPVVVLWWAGADGSIGDLSELELLATGLVVAGAAAVLAGVLMGRALDLAEEDRRIGRSDPWAALLAAAGVLGTVVTLVPALTLVLLLPDEDVPIGGRGHLVPVTWVGGAALAAGISVWAGRAVLVRGRRPGSDGTTGGRPAAPQPPTS